MSYLYLRHIRNQGHFFIYSCAEGRKKEGFTIKNLIFFFLLLGGKVSSGGRHDIPFSRSVRLWDNPSRLPWLTSVSRGQVLLGTTGYSGVFHKQFPPLSWAHQEHEVFLRSWPREPGGARDKTQNRGSPCDRLPLDFLTKPCPHWASSSLCITVQTSLPWSLFAQSLLSC